MLIVTEEPISSYSRNWNKSVEEISFLIYVCLISLIVYCDHPSLTPFILEKCINTNTLFTGVTHKKKEKSRSTQRCLTWALYPEIDLLD